MTSSCFIYSILLLALSVSIKGFQFPSSIISYVRKINELSDTSTSIYNSIISNESLSHEATHFDELSSDSNRRRQAIAYMMSLLLSVTSVKSPSYALEEGETLMYQTNSGLKYIELKEGTGNTPEYGNFCTIAYKAYIKVAGNKNKPELYDEDKAYIVKHGNGRLIPGLDEGIHTMKVGGKRRLIIPAKLGYIQNGLGPLPSGPIGRMKLGSLLDKMIEAKGGQVVIEVDMLQILEDEADQGYYKDNALTPEQFDTLRSNIQRITAENVQKARMSGTNPDSNLFGKEL